MQGCLTFSRRALISIASISVSIKIFGMAFVVFRLLEPERTALAFG
jgi:hypothetical protein